MDVQAGLFEGKLLLQLLRSFDIPHAEDLADIQKIILIAVLKSQGFHLLRITDSSGNDAVDKRGAEKAFLFDILYEVFLISPVLCMKKNVLLQLLAVCINQLAGEEGDAGLSCKEALVKKKGYLGREGDGRLLVRRAGGIVGDSCLRCVGCHVLELIGAGNSADLFPVCSVIRVVAGIHAGDDALAVDLFTVLGAAKIEGVEALLIIDHLSQSLSDGLNEGNLAVPAGFFVGHIKPVIHEGAEEVSFAELQDLDRSLSLSEDISVVTAVLQYFIV